MMHSGDEDDELCSVDQTDSNFLQKKPTKIIKKFEEVFLFMKFSFRFDHIVVKKCYFDHNLVKSYPKLTRIDLA